MGVLSDPVNALAAMFRDCRGFAAWLGLAAWNATETAARIYVDGIGPDDVDAETMSAEQLANVRPYCVLYPDGTKGYRFTREAMPNCWNGNGTIIAVLSRPYDAALSINQHWSAAAAALEAILSNDNPLEPGLLEMAATAGYLNFREVTVVFAGRTPPENRLDYGDAYDVVLVFEY
jgi:hypothetical protein